MIVLMKKRRIIRLRWLWKWLRRWLRRWAWMWLWKWECHVVVEVRKISQSLLYLQWLHALILIEGDCGTGVSFGEIEGSQIHDQLSPQINRELLFSKSFCILLHGNNLSLTTKSKSILRTAISKPMMTHALDHISTLVILRITSVLMWSS